MRALSVANAANPAGWMRNASFDLVFIVGVAALALLTGWLSVANPALFPLLLILNVWILGYHHVIATFTRLVFDVESLQQYKFLVTWLPVIVAIAVVLAVVSVGPWLLATTYLYWQWFHYTRIKKHMPTLKGSHIFNRTLSGSIFIFVVHPWVAPTAIEFVPFGDVICSLLTAHRPPLSNHVTSYSLCTKPLGYCLVAM